VAERWRRAVVGTSYVAISPQDLAEVLRGLVEELDGLLLDRTRSAAGGTIVGNQLVDAHLTNPRSLSLTLQVLLGATEELAGGHVGLGERCLGG
jgi:hypothetical protein